SNHGPLEGEDGENGSAENHSRNDLTTPDDPPPPYTSVLYAANDGGNGSRVLLLRSQPQALNTAPNTSSVVENNRPTESHTEGAPPPYRSSPPAYARYDPLSAEGGEVALFSPLGQQNVMVQSSSGLMRRSTRMRVGYSSVPTLPQNRSVERQRALRRGGCRFLRLCTKIAFFLAFASVLISLGFIIGTNRQRRMCNCSCDSLPPSNSTNPT
ncbi:hypothetical protein, partial [Candidatus Ichthyocystis hellenicum]|uniref:hypothetical protein n=1 Tax=Candidatus Ichthyocystis hellenicum TaxID=1561003 RepID=UPI001585782F